MNNPEQDSAAPAVVSATRVGRLRLLAGLRRYWRKDIVNSVDQVSVLAKIDDESGISGRYIFMTLMSAGIAVLGLLLSSPAVVIGAMLLSPLMSPIIGAGFALAVGDASELKRCGRTLAVGTLLAIGISAFIVFLSPIQTVTSEIAARTRPNLFDLLVALFSAFAGAYAMIRGREGTIVGVAIATALMPPLGVIGFGLATFNWTVFGGSLLLFITNLTTIALSAAVMARFYGFSTRLTKQQTRLQVLGILATFVVLAVPLGIALKQIGWEANASRQANAIIKAAFDPKARITQVDIDHDARPVVVTASVLTPSFRPQAEAEASAALREMLGEPVTVKIDQYRVGTNAGAAEAAELAVARAQAQAEARQRQVSELTERLAVVAGIAEQDVVIDAEHKVALAKATPIPGASLATYRELERRIAADVDGWRIQLRPPAAELPPIGFDDKGEPIAADVVLVAWAAKRVDAPISLHGRRERAEKVKEGLADLGVTAVEVDVDSGADVRAEWMAPNGL